MNAASSGELTLSKVSSRKLEKPNKKLKDSQAVKRKPKPKNAVKSLLKL